MTAFDGTVDSSYATRVFLTAEPFQRGKCVSEAAQLLLTQSPSADREANTAAVHDAIPIKSCDACGKGQVKGQEEGGKERGERGDASLTGKKRPLNTEEAVSVPAGSGGSDDKPAKQEQWPRLKSSGTNLSWIADIPYTYGLSEGQKVSRCDVTSRKREAVGGSVEVTIAATGRPQGYVPPKPSKALSQVQPQVQGNDKDCEARMGNGLISSKQKRMESRVCRRYVCV